MKKTNKGKIILTGGAGFIGSCFLWKLNKEGIDNVIVVDNLGETDKWRNLSGKRYLDYIHKNDLPGMLKERSLDGVGTIVHLGACSSTVLTDCDYYMRNNYEYSKYLAQWALEYDSRFIYASSAATYGAGDDGYDDSHGILPSLKPLNMYGYSKHLFDLWALNNGLLNKITGIKFFNVFGPNEYHKGEMMSVICKYFSDVRDKGVTRLFRSYRDEYGDGAQKRDFIYVKDAVDVLYYFFAHPGSTGIYNLGTGKARTWNDLAGAIFAAFEKPPRIEYIDMPDKIRAKYQYFTEANMEKLRKAGYTGEFTALENAVVDYSSYLKENKYL